MVIFPLAPDQTIAQMWSNGVRGGCIARTMLFAVRPSNCLSGRDTVLYHNDLTYRRNSFTTW